MVCNTPAPTPDENVIRGFLSSSIPTKHANTQEWVDTLEELYHIAYDTDGKFVLHLGRLLSLTRTEHLWELPQLERARLCELQLINDALN